jgi:hypothetical protein
LSTHELRAAGGVPPSELPPPPGGAGIFTCVSGREAVTVRAGLMDDAQRQHWLSRLPAASSVSGVVDGDLLPGNTGTGTARDVPVPVDVPRNGTAAGNGKRTDIPVSRRPDAEPALETGNAGSTDGTAPTDSGNSNGNGAGHRRNLSDAEITTLLAQGVPKRQIMAQMKGRTRKNLERVNRLAAALVLE